MINYGKTLVAFLLLVLSFGVLSESDDLNDTFEKLTAFVHKKMSEHSVPGISMGVLYGGEVYIANFGITNIDNPQKVTGDTLFQIGSITKTMTGTIIMRLVEQGKLDLDEPVRTYLPEFRVKDEDVSKNVKVRDLLTHMSGWHGDYFSETAGEGDDALDNIVSEMAELEQLAPLNTVYSYNNSAFYVAAKIIEDVTGETYQNVIQTMIFDPLGLNDTYIVPAQMMTKPFVAGHVVSDEGISVSHRWTLWRAAWAAGGAITNTRDMLTYAAFHMGDGTNAQGEVIMQSSSLQEMQSVQAPKLGTDDAIGITWHLNQVGDYDVVSHGGATFGQLSLLMMVPSEQFAIAMVTNANTGRTLNNEVTAHALELFFGAKNEVPSPIAMSESEMAEYEGIYTRPTNEIKVSVVDGKLMIQYGEQGIFSDEESAAELPFIEYSFFGIDRIMEIDGPTKAEFVRKQDGSIGWLRAGRIHVKQ